MNHLWKKLLVGGVLSLLTLGTPVATTEGSADVPLEQILERMLKRADWAEKQNPKSRYQFLLEVTSEKLKKDKTISNRDVRLFRSTPFGEGHLEELVEKNGRELTEKEKQEDAREQDQVRSRLAKGRNKGSGREDRVRFDRDMVQRYDFKLEGVDPVGDRKAYVLSFEPRAGKLPVKKQIDRALNKGAGRLWVDTETFDLARVQFRLKEKIGFWFGLVGSIYELEGDVRLGPVEEGIWLPREVRFYINGRILFSSLHRRETVRWSEFELLAAEDLVQ